MEGLLDIGHRADELQVPAIAVSADNFKAARCGECDQGIPVFLAGTKPLGNLLGCEELLVQGAGGVVLLAQETLQAGAVAQWQNDVEMQGLRSWKLPDKLRLPIGYSFTHVAGQYGLRLRLSENGEQQQHGHANYGGQSGERVFVFRHFLILSLFLISQLELLDTSLPNSNLRPKALRNLTPFQFLCL
jgi:hypothetical protein